MMALFHLTQYDDRKIYKIEEKKLLSKAVSSQDLELARLLVSIENQISKKQLKIRFLNFPFKYLQSGEPLLPEYQNKTFNPPSFNSINVLSFTTSFLPGAIILPNYYKIRNKIGFKSMLLENTFDIGNLKKSNFYFFEDDDAETIYKHYEIAAHITLSNHELLGHGSGKIFYEKDVSNGKVRDLLDPKKFVSTYYEEGQDAASAFGGMYQHFEECRADTSAVYLSFFDEILDVYEINKDENYRKSITLAVFLYVINSALKNLNSYSEELHKWKSAHKAARFAILKACIKWGKWMHFI